MSMQPDPVPENAITVIVGALDGEGRQEFTEGLGNRLHYLSTQTRVCFGSSGIGSSMQRYSVKTP